MADLLDLVDDVAEALDLMRESHDLDADILLVQIVHEGQRPVAVIREVIAQTGGTL